MNGDETLQMLRHAQEVATSAGPEGFLREAGFDPPAFLAGVNAMASAERADAGPEEISANIAIGYYVGRWLAERERMD